MRSPRFSFRESELKKIFAASDLKTTWKDKVRIALRKSPIPDPIEFLDFHMLLTPECIKIERMVRDGTYQPLPAKRILLEKSRGLCRQISLPALRDLIVLQRLSDALYADIKNKAPSNRAFFEPEDHTFSNQKKGEAGAPSYGSFHAWLNFQKMVLKFTEECDYVIVTDIANYYDTISYTHLRNIVSSQINVRETVLDTLIYVLSALLWQPDYMPRVEIGLPQINIDATRILAHCFLYELDEYLNAQKIEFTRFMDDIDVGVDTLITARHILRDIDLILQTRQVRLNSGKTRILTKKEAQAHFRVKENYILQAVQKRVERKIKSGADLSLERRITERIFTKAYVTGGFDAGAGEKILKRMLTISRKVGAKLRHRDIRHILVHRPGCRDNALEYMKARKLNIKDTYTIASFINSKYLVDDVSILSGTDALVEAKMPRNARTAALIDKLSKHLLSKKDFACAYSLIWLNSKYGNSAQIINYARLTFDLWRADGHFGRLIGGLLPILRIDKKEAELYKLLDNARNPDAYDVAAFHEKIYENAVGLNAIRPIIVASNTSKPSGISHSKYLVLLSALQNTSIKDKQRLDLLKNHRKTLEDKYYRHRIVRSLPPAVRESYFTGLSAAKTKSHSKIGTGFIAKAANANIPPVSHDEKST